LPHGLLSCSLGAACAGRALPHCSTSSAQVTVSAASSF
jgi:hypothetical protein